MKTLSKLLLTCAVVSAAIAVVAFKYWDYVSNPWTRDGQVRAQVVQITPRVSGPIVKLSIKDNQFVKTGDLLFEIDPRTFKASLDQARANLDTTRDTINSLEKQVDASKATVDEYESKIQQRKIAVRGYTAGLADAKATLQRVNIAVKSGAVSIQDRDNAKARFDEAQARFDGAEADVIEAVAAKIQAEADLAKALAELGAAGEENAQLRAAKAAVRLAELNLEFSQVTAPVDGYVTNLNLRLGSQGVANQPALALVDVNSYWVDGFFRETLIGDIREGDRAVVTLMTYPDKPLEARVDSLGWGIAQDDGSTGFDLLPTISPTFEWIRLAQRVPVRVHLDEVPDDVKLRVGTTASVLVITGTAGKESKGGGVSIPAAPRPLQ
jgi:multidrug resistance efflux pump